ncbi:MAG: hypothetical protein ABIL46_08570 [candidate division WOR-3 bacterium]
MDVETNYDKTIHFYDISAQYVKSAKIDTIIRGSDSSSKIISLNLNSNGKKTVFFINGFFEPIPYSTAGAERFHLIIELDSLTYSDTIYFSSESNIVVFYYEKLYSARLQTGLAIDMEGYFVVDKIDSDTIFGSMKISGTTSGVYSDLLNNVYDNQVTSWISGEIHFKAIKKAFTEKSKKVGGFLLPLKEQR